MSVNAIFVDLLQTVDDDKSDRDSDSDVSDNEQAAVSLQLRTGLKKKDWTKNEVLYILGHPENFLEKTTFCTFTKASWSKYVTHIFVDEAHCVLQWGEETFRPKYRELHNLKAVFPEALFVAVTATATLGN